MSKFTTAAVITAILAFPTVTLADESWTGFHVGTHIAASKLSIGPFDDSSAAYGIQAGYTHDLGKFVIGAEIDYSTAEYTFVGVTTGNIDTTRFKLRGGYDLGRAMVYGVVGVADFDGDSGSTLGLGISYKATDNIIISGEYLRDTFEVSGVDLDVDSLSVRASYKF